MKANGHDTSPDKGLRAVQASFEGGKYTCIDARDAAILMMAGAHRDQQIPDAVIMEAYGMITSGNKVQLKFTADDGHGYLALMSSYADLIKFMQGELVCKVLEAS